MASPLNYFKPIQLLKRGWNEIPDVIGGCAMSLACIVAMFGIYKYKESQGLMDGKRYRLEYTVVRPDDPLAMQAPQYRKNVTKDN